MAKALALRLVSPAKLYLLAEGSSNGVDMARFSPGPSDVRARLGLGGAVPLIGFVGRLTKDKGIPELIDALDVVLAAEPEARLLLVGWFDAGADALSPALRRRIENHPRICCTGMVDDTAPYYRAMDVLVLPTWREGFPNAVLEAQAAGVPVVTTISTGSRDSVLPEVTGLLIPPGYPQAIAEAVLTLVRDPRRRRRMGRAARAWVRKHYVERRVLGLTAKFYLGLLQANRGAQGSAAGDEIDAAFQPAAHDSAAY
jgi:glycosyltransferase involved in cell wall biosynthesis